MRDPVAAVPQLVALPDRLDLPAGPSNDPSRRDLLHLLEGRTITDLDPSVLAALSSLDGPIVCDRSGRLLVPGAILRHPPLENLLQNSVVEGARRAPGAHRT